MSAPISTYRVQFRDGMTFARAAEIVPYLKVLGVSHLYASPIYAATPGSTHGYDVTDHNRFDPELGGEAGFATFSAALKQAGLGLILDIVPNHMAASLANPWWRDVIEWGEESAYAAHFDIDWREPLTLPALGQPLSDCLAAGELVLGVDGANGTLGLRYYESVLPLVPSSYAAALAGMAGPMAEAIVGLAANLTAETADDFHASMRASLSNNDAETFAEALHRQSQRAGLVAAVHELQPWRLGYWREARSHLSYRRFFEVTGLAGVRVEDARVFDDVHRLTLELVADGRVDGLRIDHVDGLADPDGYLRALRERISDTWLVVEKILESSEALPADWPIAGTTGYEFIDALGGLLVDRRQADAFEAAYSQAIGETVDLTAEHRLAKQQMLAVNFETELTALVERSASLAEGRFDADALREAITALIVAFPVYRTYGNAEGQSSRDLTLLETVAAEAVSALPERSEEIGFIGRLLRLDVEDEARAAALDVTVRFQQLSGPITAKAVEDTLFYRRNRLVGLNEVGGDPETFGRPLEAFHAAMAARVASQPEGLLATATHDTKRGEDARARLYALSEAPEVWAEGVGRWRALHAGLVQEWKGRAAPSAELEWLAYQALAGMWPLTDSGDRGALLAGLRARFSPYLSKVVREAKQFTNWVESDAEYEAIIDAYGRGLLADNGTFIDDFAATLQPFMRAGALNSLSQIVLKLAAPGIPDIYQGTENWDLSLVDPDNRLPVDFARLAAQLAAGSRTTTQALLASWRDGRIKQRLLSLGLGARAAQPALFTHGAYRAVGATGGQREHIVAFVRQYEEAQAVVVAPRWTFGLLGEGDALSISREAWGDTTVTLPETGRPLVNVLSGPDRTWSGQIAIGELLNGLPVALLVTR